MWAALDQKVDKTTTINSYALSSANIMLTKADLDLADVDNTADADKPVSNFQQSALDLKVDKATTINAYPLTANISLTKGDVGLSNVDNTADTDKPVSAAQQAALDLKATKSTTINSHPLSANVVISAADVGGSVTPSANSLVLRDANANSRANIFVPNLSTVVSSSTAVTMTAASPQTTYITGTVAQTIILPVASALTINTSYTLHNRSTQTITLNAQDTTTLVSSIYSGSTVNVVLVDNSTANGTWISARPGAASCLLMTDTSGQVYANTNCTWTNNNINLSNTFLNANMVVNIGGLNQQSNTANNNTTVLNIRTPGDVRGCTFQMNSGQSCQIISEYGVGGPVTSYAIYRGSTKFLTFYNATTLGCLVQFQVPNINVTSFMQPSVNALTTTGSITTPVTTCNSTSAFTVSLPATPSAGEYHEVVNVNTGIVTVSGTGYSTMLGLNDFLGLFWSGSAWVTLTTAFNANNSNNYLTVTSSTTIVNPFTIVNSASATNQTLPAANQVPVGKHYKISNIGAGIVTVVIPGGTNTTLASQTSGLFISSGSIWII